MSWTPEIEAASGQHGGCPEQNVGAVVAGFGAVRQLREGEEGTRTRLGYNFIVNETEGKSLTITPKHDVTEGCMSHAINHTCHPGFANCRFVHAGIVGGWSEDEQGGIGGRREGVPGQAVVEVGALVGSGPGGIPVRVQTW